jgi:DNA invertase Pin-like site-specific DNA recombinase
MAREAGRRRQRRAIGIVRVSQVNGRAGESFASPAEQRERIEVACDRDGLELLEVVQELDVSGGTPLERRTGLRTAVEAIEEGTASVLVAAYFDRLVRSLTVQAELIERVEAAGGQVLTVDVGQVTNGSASQWLSGTMHGMVAEYQRRTAKERIGDAQRRAVARGVCPFPNVPPGYHRGVDGVLIPHETEAPIVAEAFKRRASGASVKAVRAYLVKHGIARSYSGTISLLESSLVVGEIRFGDLVNEHAHEPIVDRDVFSAVQRITVSKGRRGTSERLLARLGVLRCASCGSRMVVGTTNNHGNGLYHFYRCTTNGDCTRKVTIAAEIAESTIVERVRAALADIEGRASAAANVRDAESDLEKAELALRAAVQAFTGFEDVAETRERLIQLREARDEAQEKLDRLGGVGVALSVNASTDWERLTLDEKRSLIRATVERASVAPGRGGADRIAVDLFVK